MSITLIFGLLLQLAALAIVLRQVRSRLLMFNGAILIVMLCIFHGLPAVSYTHLDVYKRQAYSILKRRYLNSLGYQVPEKYQSTFVCWGGAAEVQYIYCLLYTSRCV